MNGLPDNRFILIDPTTGARIATPSTSSEETQPQSDEDLQDLSTIEEVNDAIEDLENDGYQYSDVYITDISDDGSGEFVVQFDYTNSDDTKSVTTAPFSDDSTSYDSFFGLVEEKLGIEDIEKEQESIVNDFLNGRLFKYEAERRLEKLGAKCLFSDDNTIKYVFNGTTHSYTIQNNDEPLLTRGAGGSNVELTEKENALSDFLETYADGGDFDRLKQLLGDAGVTYDQEDDTIRFNFQGCDYEFSSKTENPQNVISRIDMESVITGMDGVWQQFFDEVDGGFVFNKQALIQYFGEEIANKITTPFELLTEYTNKNRAPEEPVDMSPNAQIDRMIQDFISGKISTYDAKDLIEGLGGTVHSYSLGSGQDKYSIEFTFNGKRQKITYDSSIEDKEGTKIIKEEDLSKFLDSCSMLPSTKAQIFNGWFKKVTDGYYILDEQVNDRDGTYDIHLANLRETVGSKIITIDDVKKYLTNYVNNTKAQTIVDAHEFIRDYGRYQRDNGFGISNYDGKYYRSETGKWYDYNKKSLITEDECQELAAQLDSLGVEYDIFFTGYDGSNYYLEAASKYMSFKFEGVEYLYQISYDRTNGPLYDLDCMPQEYIKDTSIITEADFNAAVREMYGKNGSYITGKIESAEKVQEFLDYMYSHGYILSSKSHIENVDGIDRYCLQFDDPYNRTSGNGSSKGFYTEIQLNNAVIKDEKTGVIDNWVYDGHSYEESQKIRTLLIQQFGFESLNQRDEVCNLLLDAMESGQISAYRATELISRFGGEIDADCAGQLITAGKLYTPGLTVDEQYYHIMGRKYSVKEMISFQWLDGPKDNEVIYATKSSNIAQSIKQVLGIQDNGGNSSRRSSYESSNESNDSNEVPTTSSNPFVDYNNGRYDENSTVFSLSEVVSLVGVIDSWSQFFVEVNGGYVLDKTALNSYFDENVASGITDLNKLIQAYKNKNAKTTTPEAVTVKTETDNNGNKVNTYQDSNGNTNKVEHVDSKGNVTAVEYYEDNKLVTDETIYNEIKNDLNKVLSDSTYSASIKSQLSNTYASLLKSGKTPDQIRAYMKKAIANAEKINQKEQRIYYIVAMMKIFAGIEEDKLSQKEQAALKSYRSVFA